MPDDCTNQPTIYTMSTYISLTLFSHIPLEALKSIPFPDIGPSAQHAIRSLLQSPNAFSSGFQLVSSQHTLVPGVAPAQVQEFMLPFVELHEVPVSPFLQTAPSFLLQT